MGGEDPGAHADAEEVDISVLDAGTGSYEPTVDMALEPAR
jgi:hypothetical protein